MFTESPHVLMVDDNGDVREVIKDILQDQGCRVTLAAGGVEMRGALDLQGFDAVVLDVNMPGERSASLARHAAALGLPTVMISGDLGSMEAFERDGLQLLRKPFRMAELHAAIDAALGRIIKLPS
jgi:two-component system, OmpR family, response regulator